MRFDIRSGGIVLILVGMGVLSTAVFMLGLVAGYEMARQNQADTSQVATVYPLPPSAAPAATLAASSPTPSPSAEAAGSAVGTVPRPAATTPSRMEELPRSESVAASKRPAPVMTASPIATGRPSPVQTPPRESLAAVKPAAPSPVPPAVRPPVSAPAESSVAGAKPLPPLLRHHGYNIQIDAAMDRAGADQMMDRLRQLGYQPHLLQTEIGGQTWYRVQVGPYATQADARAAQEKLRARYNSTFNAH
jgi:septal ring-binding cell division protein DamX